MVFPHNLEAIMHTIAHKSKHTTKPKKVSCASSVDFNDFNFVRSLNFKATAGFKLVPSFSRFPTIPQLLRALSLFDSPPFRRVLYYCCNY